MNYTKIYSALFICFTLFTHGQGKVKRAEIKFDSLHYHLKPIRVGEEVNLKVPFKNTGDEALIVRSATSMDNNSVITALNQVISPGESSYLEVKIQNDSEGFFDRHFNVLADFSNIELTVHYKVISNVGDRIIPITFKDTLFNIAFDSVNHNFGRIDPSIANDRLVKYFKYVGTKPLFIENAWTSDPYFICEYPHEPLIPNKIYSYRICFYFNNIQFGKMNKTMGFRLSDGSYIALHFKAEFIPLKKIMKELGPFKLNKLR